ncbi:MAG TPA: hypothetical protein VHB47_13555 [Thermoanaerobaculia bacterium]|jgi:hypothetical protein|nr:hypothetical protein [Thermoanaerobaculia bacterium]
MAKVVEEGWLQLLDNPAVLLAPRLNGPAIRQACNRDRVRFSKAAAIVLAAEPAVHAQLSHAMRRTLTALRDGTQTGLDAGTLMAATLPGTAADNGAAELRTEGGSRHLQPLVRHRHV